MIAHSQKLDYISVQIRQERKHFRKTHLSRLFNVNRSTIEKWINERIIPKPKNNCYTEKDLTVICQKLKYQLGGLEEKAQKDWRELLNSQLYLDGGGIFLGGKKITRGFKKTVKKMIKEYGLWNAQGLNNHVHVFDYSSNPAVQAILARQIINVWLEKIKELAPTKKVIIYWNGPVKSTVCIYLLPPSGAQFLKKFDKYLRMERVSKINLCL